MQTNQIEITILKNKIPFFDIFCQIEKEYNLKLYFVGGFVRDLILNQPSSDLDIVPFNMSYDKVSRIIKYRIKSNAISFKDNVRLIKNDLIIDVSKPRGLNISEDISMRDFTINNLAIDTKGNIYGDTTDILNRYICSVYEKNFDDDPLRILRAFRFVSELGFDLEEKTKEKIILKKQSIKNVAIERIFEEIKKLFTGDFFEISLNLMVETEFIFEIIPELKQTIEIGKSKYHYQDVFEHTISATINAHRFTKLLKLDSEKSLILITTLLLHDLGKADKKYENTNSYINHEKLSYKIADNILNRLNYPKKIKEKILDLIINHNKIRIYATNNAKDKTMQKFIYNNKKLLEEHILVCLADNLVKKNDMNKIYNTIKKIRKLNKEMNFENTKLISGNDLIKLGLKPSPMMKEILSDIHFKLTINEIDNKTKAIKYIKNNYLSGD